jgi:hypothetical protein
MKEDNNSSSSGMRADRATRPQQCADIALEVPDAHQPDALMTASCGQK